MLRFGSKPSSKPSSFAGGSSRGVWKLLLLLGLVMVMIRQLDRPEAGAMLGRVLGIDNQPADGVASPTADAATFQPATVEGERDDAPRTPPLDSNWNAVQDNAMFSLREQPAWFQLFERVQQVTPAELAQEAVNVVYAQMVNQPDAYRAAPVRVRGRVLRESVKRAPTNELGIESYHQLWLAPAGGGDRPFLIYSLELPADFPRGDNIAADVTVEGLFFKNYTFPYEGGMGLAPVVVTRNVGWTPTRAKPQAAEAEQVEWRWLLVGAGGAAMAAAGFVAWVMRQTRRPRLVRDERPVDLSHLEAGP